MTIEKPFFMTNKEWFYFDEKNMKYFLTKRAPKKAKESYVEFYSSVFGGRQTYENKLQR